MRLLFFLIWVAAGLCFFLAGCRVSLSAGNLELSAAVDAPEYMDKENPALYNDSTGTTSETTGGADPVADD